MTAFDHTPVSDLCHFGGELFLGQYLSYDASCSLDARALYLIRIFIADPLRTTRVTEFSSVMYHLIGQALSTEPRPAVRSTDPQQLSCPLVSHLLQA